MEIEVCENFTLPLEVFQNIAMMKTGWELEKVKKLLARIYLWDRRYTGRFGRYLVISFIGGPEKYCQCFIKLPPFPHSPADDIVQNLDLFNRESGIYANVFPNILKPEDSEIIPRYYYSQKNYVLIIELMGAKRYKRIRHMSHINFEHCCVALKSLARLHARSIVFDNTSGHNLLEKCKTEWDVNLQGGPNDDSMEQFYCAVGQSLSEMFKHIPQLIPLELKRFTYQFKKSVQSLFKTVTAEDYCHMRVLCHSDLQMSNLLFHYNKYGKPDRCCMIDFQFAKYSSLAFDVWSFLYATTTKDLRDEHLKDLYKVYYKELVFYMLDGEIDVPNFFRFKDFLVLMEKDRYQGLIQGILSIYYVLFREAKARYVDDFTRTWKKIWMNSQEVLNENHDQVQRLKHRIVEALLELYPYLMMGESSDSEGSDDPISVGDDMSDQESPSAPIQNGVSNRIRHDDSDEDLNVDDVFDRNRNQIPQRQGGPTLIRLLVLNELNA